MRLLLLLVTVLLTGCSLFSSSSQNVANDAQWQRYQTVASDETGWLIFGDQNRSNVGLVFYPGGKVSPEAYGQLANTLANKLNVLVVIVPMPLDLAVFGSKRGTNVQTYFSTIDTWIIGGHSLGGTMAANLAYSHPDDWQGLLLLASYPQDKHDFSDRSIKAISIIGDQDGLISQQRWRQSLSLLPDDAVTTVIQGGNHAGFGTYGVQSGDSVASISQAEQREQTVQAIELWFKAFKY